MEELENPQNERLFIISDESNPVYKYYKLAQGSFWVEEEVDSELLKDISVWPGVDPKIQYLIKHQIAFFIIADGIVNKNISEYIESDITDREVQLWYNFQKMMEDIHNMVYVKLADNYIRDSEERKQMFNSIETFPAIKKKINWIKKWLGSNSLKLDPEDLEIVRQFKNICIQNLELLNSLNKSEIKISKKIKKFIKKLDSPKTPLSRKIIANIIMEGLFFQSSFGFIFWYGHYFGDLPGLTKMNESISRDEGLHTEFGIYLYNHRIKHKLDPEIIYQMFREAVEVETEFILEGLNDGLIGMNSELMTQYIKFVADKLLTLLNLEKIYHVKNPFKFMEKQSVSVRITDFFQDNNVSEYGKSSSGTNSDDLELKFDYDD